MFRFVVVLFFVFMFLFGMGQQEQILADLLQDLGFDQEVDQDFFEQLMERMEDKINLNTATEQDLMELRVLTSDQIKAILDYRQRTGEILTFDELLFLPQINQDVVDFLRLFFVLKPVEQQRRSRTRGLILTDFVYQLKDSVYGRMPVDYRQRFYYGNKQVRFVAVFDNDAGERIDFNRRVFGLDYSSFSLEMNELGKGIKKLVIGDYKVMVGNGVMLWNGFKFGKSDNAVNLFDVPQGIRAWSSSMEYNYFRGVGVVVGNKHQDLGVFGSYAYRDGTLRVGDDGPYISSFYLSGYHRDSLELAKDDTFSEFMFGGYYNLKLHNLLIGAGLMAYRFDKPLILTDYLYRASTFDSESGYNLTFYGIYSILRSYIFWEFSSFRFEAPAGILGVQVPISSDFSLAGLVRYYAPDYFAFYANAFAEGNLQNELGYYVGFRYGFKYFAVSGFYDRFEYPYFRYRAYEPNLSGEELRLRIDYQRFRFWSGYFRFKYKLKPENQDVVNNAYLVGYEEKYSLRLVNQFKWHKLVYKSQLDWNFNQTLGLKGYYAINDLKLRRIEINDYSFSGFLRVAYYNGDYDVRDFVFEPDLYYRFTFEQLFGRGWRTAAMFEIGYKRRYYLRYKLAINFEQERYQGIALDSRLQFRIKL